jgi:hypothetical protein
MPRIKGTASPLGQAHAAGRKVALHRRRSAERLSRSTARCGDAAHRGAEPGRVRFIRSPSRLPFTPVQGGDKKGAMPT